MQLLDSIVEGALLMPSRKDADALIAAYVRYMATGEEPSGLKGYALAQWVSNLPAIENARARAENGYKGGRPRKRDGNQTGKLNGNQTGKLNGNQTGKLNGNQTPQNRESEQVSSSSSSSYSSKETSQVDSGRNPSREGVQGEGFEPPTLDEARAHFAANSLRGDPDLFWATYEATGWRDGNGNPIASWTAQALRWSRRQVGIDAERAARGEPPASEASWRPAAKLSPEEELRLAEERLAAIEAGGA